LHFSASSAAATPSPSSSLSQPLLIGRAKAKPSRKRKASLPHHVSGPRGKRARQRFRSEGWRTGSDNKTTSAGPYSDRASLSPPPPTQRVKERTELGNYNKLPLKIQKLSMTITDIVFHPVASSAELGFLDCGHTQCSERVRNWWKRIAECLGRERTGRWAETGEHVHSATRLKYSASNGIYLQYQSRCDLFSHPPSDLADETCKE
jgi:hypothetical protein